MIELTTESEWNNCCIPERFIDKFIDIRGSLLHSKLSCLPKKIFLKFIDNDLLIDNYILISACSKYVSYKSYIEYDYNSMRYVLDEVSNSLLCMNFDFKYLKVDTKSYSFHINSYDRMKEYGNTISISSKRHVSEYDEVLNSTFINIYYSCQSIINDGIINHSYDRKSSIFLCDKNYIVKKLYKTNDSLHMEISNFNVDKNSALGIKSSHIDNIIKRKSDMIFSNVLRLLKKLPYSSLE